MLAEGQLRYCFLQAWARIYGLAGDPGSRDRTPLAIEVRSQGLVPEYYVQQKQIKVTVNQNKLDARKSDVH